MQPIILCEPVASHSALERLHLFPGRHLGEQEFEQLQAYTDRRISPLLSGRDPGILHGLEIRTGNLGTPGDGLTVSSGLALAGNGQMLGLFHPLRESWQTLIDEFVKELGSGDAAGLFYLTLKRSTRYVDADPNILPCQRREFDPTQDARQVLVGSLGLTRLGMDEAGLATASREEIENWVAANNVERELLKSICDAVPLGLLVIDNLGTPELPDYAVRWFSQAAARYLSLPYGGYQVLQEQVREAFRRLLLEAQQNIGEGETLLDYLNANLVLNFLPAAGELPKELIRDIASAHPSVGWLPRHLYVDMVAVPEESVREIIERHLPRRAIDLRRPNGDCIRLMVAVNEPDYKPHLMRFPQTDRQLHDDIYRYFQRSYNVWMQWMDCFNRLYYLAENDVLSAGELTSIDLPQPIASPLLPQTFFQQTIDLGRNELGEGQPPSTPYPYDQGVPAEPQFYRAWGRVVDNQPGQPVLPPLVLPPEENGLVIKLTIARHELEELDNDIRATRSRLEKTRDYLLLQRQQLDNQTVSLAALAGGVAGDGSGLQVARWLPFAQLTAPENVVEEGTDGVGDTNTIPTMFALNSGKVEIGELAKQTASIAGTLNLKTNFFSNTLRKAPTILSNVQLSLNKTLLDKIATAPKVALTRPAFEAKEFRFGVMSHIRPEIQEYKKLHRGMSELITTLAELFDKSEAFSLRKKLNALGKPIPLSDLGIDQETVASSNQLTAEIYEAMFNAGKILTQQIAFMEGRYARIEALLEGRLRSRLGKEAQIEKLGALIRNATEDLESIDKRRAEYLGDYGVAQRLLDEDWLAIFKENQERIRILTIGVKGVYYVRERQTPISLPMADPLELRYGSSGDIVPGCDWSIDPELPEELEEFHDTVLEIPMADWTSLKGLTAYIPAKPRLQYIANVRKARIAAKQSRGNNRRYQRSSLNISLANVHLQSQSTLMQMARYTIAYDLASIRQQQQEAAKVLSLEDVQSGTKGRLKDEAQSLGANLERAVHCMLDRLSEISPSIRLQWAQMAEDDRLQVERVETWPGMDRAEREDFNATRTLAELVAWWFRQIEGQATANSRAAMRNMLRATLIHAALGDPTEILQGEVHVPPRLLAPGEILRLRLNRQARPGTVLQLLDTSQRVVALLNVEDDDEKGALARVTQVSDKTARVTTQYRVVANKLTRLLS